MTMATLVIVYGSMHGHHQPHLRMGCGASATRSLAAARLSRAYGLYDAIAGTYNTTNPDSASMPSLCGGGSDPCH